MASLRSEVHDALGNRNAADDQFKGAVLDEVAGIKAALALEREERVAEDDEIVQVSGRGCASTTTRSASRAVTPTSSSTRPAIASTAGIRSSA